jgi:hypothetical protein
MRVSFSNQVFAEEQFGKNALYEAKATVVVDNIIEIFYSAGVLPSISARLIVVTEKKPIP